MEELKNTHQIQVWSRQESENQSIVDRNCLETHIWISFHDPSMPPTRLPVHPLRRASLQIPVHDAEIGDRSTLEKLVIFNKVHAKMIVDFVDCWKKHVSKIIVNCEAGVSRSAGCAAALSIWLKGHDSNIANGKNGFHPNATIKSLILREVMERQNGEA